MPLACGAFLNPSSSWPRSPNRAAAPVLAPTIHSAAEIVAPRTCGLTRRPAF